jgi:hypothetical protein
MKMFLYTPPFFLLFFFHVVLQSTPAFSQDSVSSYSSMAEKVYLQSDNKVYTTDQAIWFKAVVANAAYHTLSGVSAVLYVELIDANENIVERKLIKIEHGVGEGFFQLSPIYIHGIYQLRAYTEWNRNFVDGFFFKEYILVSGAEKKNTPFEPIKRLTVIEGQRKERRLNVQVDPALSDSMSGKAIKFVVEVHGKKDTLSLKRNRSNQYLLNYLVPPECELLTLQIEMDNEVNYAKTIVIDTSFIDLQFFPESGELVQGLPAILGFKALDYQGRARTVEGEIINTKGEIISLFKTNQLGMGSVNLGMADSNAKYVASIRSVTGIQKTYFLPAVAAKGNNLFVRKRQDKILIKASSNYLTEDSIIVRASCRGIIYFDFAGKLKNGTLEFPVDGKLLPEGIIDFTFLIAKSTMPVAERLYFNERPTERLRISLSSDKSEYGQREKTDVSITIQDQTGKPATASISVLALNQSNQGELNGLRQNILSFFLLSSDLKGEIENPGYYFKDNSDRFEDLDVLLLTQGWRRYNYVRERVAFEHQPETGLTLSGDVKGGLSDKKKIKGAELTMMAFSEPPFFSNGKTDSLGRFSFLMDDEYGDQVGVVIQSANKANKKIQYIVALDKKEPPPIVFNHARSIQKPDSIIQAYIKQSIENKKVQDAYRSATEGIILDEVIVKTRVLSPEQKEVTEKYGEPAIIISGKEIQAKEDKWSYGLYSVLMFNFPDQINVMRVGNGMLYARLHNSEPTLVVIDGIPVLFRDYRYIPGIPPSEVKSFELIPYAKNFMRLLCEAAGGCPLYAPNVGNVIAIYTHAGKGIFGIRAPIGISQLTMPVFSKPREFYAPRYEQLKPEDWQKPDLRNLVHRDPILKTDSTGRAAVSFYNSDNTGSIRVIVEAISKNGEIGYSELLYDVRKKDLVNAVP